MPRVDDVHQWQAGVVMDRGMALLMQVLAIVVLVLLVILLLDRV